MKAAYFLNVLLLLVGLGSVCSCREDPCIAQELTAQVRFTSPTSQTLTNLAILDLQSASYTIRSKYTLAQDNQFSVALPLNMNAAQTRYTFQLNGKPDTLTVTYSLTPVYIGQTCGYWVQVNRPAAEPVVRSSIGTVQAALLTESAYRDTLYGPQVSLDPQIKIRIRL